MSVSPLCPKWAVWVNERKEKSTGIIDRPGTTPNKDHPPSDATGRIQSARSLMVNKMTIIISHTARVLFFLLRFFLCCSLRLVLYLAPRPSTLDATFQLSPHLSDFSWPGIWAQTQLSRWPVLGPGLAPEHTSAHAEVVCSRLAHSFHRRTILAPGFHFVLINLPITRTDQPRPPQSPHLRHDQPSI
jgi:hypothetical protein